MMCGQLHTLHRDDRGGEECRRSVRWERKGPGSAVDRLLDIFHIKITHLLAKIKFRYFCNATFVLMYYLVLHCVSSCLVFGRECNDAQSLLIREMYAAICHTIAHLLFCLNHSVVLKVSPIWAGSFRTQGQGELIVQHSVTLFCNNSQIFRFPTFQIKSCSGIAQMFP